MAVPDIFDEVAEDLRADRARAMMRRYGGLLAGAAVLVVIAAGGYEIWASRRATADLAQATRYLAAQRIAAGPAPSRAASLPELESLARDGDVGYRTLARLRAAGVKAEAGDLPGAVALWNEVSADSAADPLLRDIATLQWATHQIDTASPGDLTLRLAPLMAQGNRLRPMAEELSALLALRQGQTNAALDIYRRLATDTAAPDGLRGRANGLLQRLGGGA
jgi:hypothetical protein